MTEKKFLDVRIEWNVNKCFDLIAINARLNDWSRGDRDFIVTPLPELASEEQLIDIIRKWEDSQSLVKINYESLVKALLGKVALPSPEPEKETKGIDIGVVVKDENTLISPLLIDGKVVDKVGIYPSEVENIMVWVVDRNIRINPKPPEKKELPILIPLLVDEEPDKKLMIDTINALIDIIREMREGK